MDASASLWAVFASSFLAATLLPGGSELALYGVLKLHPELKSVAVGVATLGNTLGALTSYVIGRLIPFATPQPDSPAPQPSASKRLRGIATVQRYGAPVLLLSWVPIVGDPLCVAAGWLRINVFAATFFIALGKLARYLAVAAMAV